MCKNYDFVYENKALQDNDFDSLLINPYDKHYGPEEDSSLDIELKDLQIRLGNRPLAVNIGANYPASHSDLPESLEGIMVKYDLWAVFHSFGIRAENGTKHLKTVEYEADFGDEDIYTTDLMPETQVRRKDYASAEFSFDIKADGSAQAPETDLTGTLPFNLGSLKASLNLTAQAGIFGRVTFSTITPRIQTVGIGSTRCTWLFHTGKEGLYGDQVMVQTVLTKKGKPGLNFKIRVRAAFKTGWVSFPVMRQTEWLQINCLLEN